MKEAERRQTLGSTAASSDAARALSERARLTAFHRGSLPVGSISSPRLSFRPGFLGRGLHGRYPASPVPVQGCTSHPGHDAGRHDAQAAREQRAKPPAGTAPAPPFGLPPEGVLRESGINCGVIDMVTNVNRKETASKASPPRGRLPPPHTARGGGGG